ncbi:hypothetical protein G6F70_004511 [Rhizopus microsporus]|uniref:BZIP domain-containing protein n=2 Tax=Rhizopus TaxID=4842 RepID=A0A367JR37_RHIAZ|nr:hypothetical protein G6F71_004590 [Rhizopus microsporus]KAG1199907.1 hypothetical protein G6F70_004511 [Rhizopus microsporus]KAG1211603.1 hypothetical protein G6F69_004454 [Rhizopus microsporus]ORE15461.1 hypothetical protein BCV71DRAFT_33150 [Rhizopus microsporus]RCH92366.1 hypothetical protein CU097_009545 [Rhizopus azygosporus]
MSDVVINTSSYEEAMNLSDLEEFDFIKESSHQSHQSANAMTDSNNQQQPVTDQPIKIRKKPGRKPNPASPALRKAQNRAAQRAFRERKERYMKELEADITILKQDKEKLVKENEKLSIENETLKAESWYLKGIVLSLQLVCLQRNLVIPQHCPHINEDTLNVIAQSMPQSIASYLNVNAKNKLQLSSRLFQRTHDQHHPSQNPNTVHTQKQSVYSNSPQQSADQWNMYNNQGNSTVSSSDPSCFANLPPLSPMTASETPNNVDEIPRPVPNEPIQSNLAAIQALRLRLRLQAATTMIPSIPAAIQPTLLQLTIPHDPRIDLIPTPHMRDRMILFRDLFDLDDCFRCLLSGSVFHGGDPAVAGNWQLPAEFFEKYWFLTIDYNLRRYTNEWRKKQGLEEIQPPAPIDLHSLSPPQQPLSQPQLQPQATTFHEPPEMAAMELAEGLSMMGISMSESVSSAPSAIWDDYNLMLSTSATDMHHGPF